MIIVKIVLAIFLLPVAAFLQVGLSTHFWMNIILTLLGGLPLFESQSIVQLLAGGSRSRRAKVMSM